MKSISTSKVVALTTPLAALAVSNVNAAYDAFLKIEGPDVKGESRVEGHEDSIEILSFSWGVSNPGAIGTIGGGSGGGKVSVSDFKITKRTDKASPQLFRSAVVAEHWVGDEDHAPIRLVMVYSPEDSDESVEVFSIELDNSIISELRGEVVPAARGDDGDRPTESLSLSFGKIKMNFSDQDDGGNYLGLEPDRAISVDNPALED